MSYVRDIPKGSRLAVSTNLLGSLIAVCMRATGQAESLTGALTEAERRTTAARAILGEWLGGSGGGWHRDDADAKQTKAILYLSDVEMENGPFQFIEGSHKPWDIYRMAFKYNFSFGQNRFTDQELEKVIQDQPNRLKTFTGKAGTLILTDTRGLHRGMPIRKGERYALTNYNWVRTAIPEHVQKVIIKN